MTQIVSRDELTRYLDEFLDTANVPDKSPNGLQVQGRDRIGKVAFAVDASAQTIEASAKAKAGMLIVHHGLWWGRHEQIVGNMHQRIAGLIRADLSLYAAHIPLDCHAEVGNNVELARLFGLDVETGFGEYMGVTVGVIATAQKPLKRDVFVEHIGKALSAAPAVLDFGPRQIRRVAIISGAGAGEAEAARDAGCDTLVTGESSHAAYHSAREAGINLIFGGHYATETVGLKALARHLKKKFSITTTFVPAPTGY